MDGQYIEPRTVLWAAAEISWQDAKGANYRVPGTLEDTSLSGACIRVQRPFTIGSRITIKWHREQFAAVARNCRSDGHGFLLGVRREPKLLEAESSPVAKAARSASEDSGPEKATVAIQRLPLPIASTPASSSHNSSKRDSESPAALPQLRTRRIRPLAEPTPLAAVAESHVSNSPPRPERKAMQPKKLFPHFWRRQQDGGTPANTISMEAPVNKPSSTQTETCGGPSALLSYEDIYRAAGIMSPGSGYGIHKVVEMMDNERIRDLSKDIKRASVLMALDAAGISADDLLTDATRRQNALSSYEAAQRKQLEDFEARKAKENFRIEEEMEKVRSHYAERIQANLDQVSKEKDALRNWQSAMQHESQRIADVIELCSKQPVPARPVSAMAAAAGTQKSDKS